jgi:multiple sugar transport system ATP-binding protein
VAEIRLEGVSKVFDKTVAVDDVQLHVADGEFMVLLGPSGCGKTTLLRLLAGLEYPNGGRVRIGDTDVTDLPPRKRDLAMVFQSYAVFPHLTVFDNIAFGLRMRKVDRAKVHERVERAATLVELGDLLGRYPGQLSGGQRQRVAVALLRLTFRAQLKQLVAELKTTTIYVTHDQVEALSLGNRIAVMNKGRIIQCDTPGTVYGEPASRFVGAFIGNPPMNFLTGRVHRNGGPPSVTVADHVLQVAAELDGEPDGEVLVGIRAENIRAEVEPFPDALQARTRVVEPLGSHLLITADVGEQPIKITAPADFPAHPNRELWLRFDPAKVRMFRPS